MEKLIKRDKIFKLIYGYFEVFVDVVSGGFILFATTDFLSAYLPGIKFPNPEHSRSIIFMVRSFGYMVLMSGLMQFFAINYGGYILRKYFIMALIVGDFMQLLLSGIFFSDIPEWNNLLIFNFVFTSLLIISRHVYLFTGIPQNARYVTGAANPVVSPEG